MTQPATTTTRDTRRIAMGAAVMLTAAVAAVGYSTHLHTTTSHPAAYTATTADTATTPQSADANLNEEVNVGPASIRATAGLLPGAEDSQAMLVTVFITNNTTDRLPADATVALTAGGSDLDPGAATSPLTGTIAAGSYAVGTYTYERPTTGELDEVTVSVQYEGTTATFRGAV